MPPQSQKIPAAQIATIKLWIEQGAKENAGSKVNIPAMPKTDIGLKSVVKGRPEGAAADARARQAEARPGRGRAPARRGARAGDKPVGAARRRRRAEAGHPLQHRHRRAPRRACPFEHGQINSIKFSRNAKFVLVAGGKGGQSGKAVLFNVETGEKVLEVGKSETDAILAADISADQTQIAVGGPSKLVRIYSTADGTVLREIKKHTDWVTAVEYSPDGVLARDRRPQRRPVRVGSVHRPRVLQPPRPHRDDHRRVVARRLERAGVVAARTRRSSSGRWRTAATSRTGARTRAARRACKFTHDGKLAIDRPRQGDEALGPERRGAEDVRGVPRPGAAGRGHARQREGDRRRLVRAW